MAAMAMERDLFMPRAPAGMGRGLVLAIAAHVLLVVALSFSVSWHSQTLEGVEAELWASVPQIAAPRPAEPAVLPAQPPAPSPAPAPKQEITQPAAMPDPQIAIERAERKEAKRQAAEQALLAEQKAADKQKALQAKQLKVTQDKAQQQKVEAAETAQLAIQREANIKRILGQAEATGSSNAAVNTAGNATQQAGPSADYLGRIKARIKANMSFPDTLAGNPAVEIEVRLTAEGRIIQPSRVVKPSGAREWDEAVLRAIAKTDMLPRDEAGKVPAVMIIVYRPKD